MTKKKMYIATGNAEFPAYGNVFGVFSTHDAALKSARGALPTGNSEVLECYLDEEINYPEDKNNKDAFVFGVDKAGFVPDNDPSPPGPYSFADKLSDKSTINQAIENRELFEKKYGQLIAVADSEIDPSDNTFIKGLANVEVLPQAQENKAFWPWDK